MYFTVLQKSDKISISNFYSRQVKIGDKDSWMKVEMLYRCMKIYNIIYMKWLKFVIAPTVFSACATIGLTLYFTCRPTAMPLIIYSVFPLSAMTVLFVYICYAYIPAYRCKELKEGLEIEYWRPVCGFP